MTNVATSTVLCPRCERELPEQAAETGGARCFHCESFVEATIFPAAFRRIVPLADQAVVSGEASCFFHGERVAAASCSNCGRFLCHFCRIEWSGKDLCVACVEAMRQPDKTAILASSRFHFDSLALALATFPSLLVFPSLLTAPLALGLALVTVRRSCSITPRSKWRVVIAMLVSLAVIGGWAWLLIYSFAQARSRAF